MLSGEKVFHGLRRNTACFSWDCQSLARVTGEAYPETLLSLALLHRSAEYLCCYVALLFIWPVYASIAWPIAIMHIQAALWMKQCLLHLNQMYCPPMFGHVQAWLCSFVNFACEYIECFLVQVASHAQKYFIRLNSMNKKDKRRSSIHDITSVNPANDMQGTIGFV